MNHRIIFDTDSAVFNDAAAALAMLLPHQDQINILGITVVAGNHTVAQGTEHMLHLLEVTGATHLPLYLGAEAPLLNTPRLAAKQEAEFGPITFKGAFDAKPDLCPPHGGHFATVRPQTTGAVQFIINTLEHYPNEVTIVALGPMTNLAMAFLARPDLASTVKQLVFMGGNVRVPGNTTRSAEFNIWFDPEAAAAVLRSTIPHVVMFGLDITNQAPIKQDLFNRIVTADTPLTRLMLHDLAPRFTSQPDAYYYAWDCITAAWLIDPSIVTAVERLPLTVETEFGPTYGATRVTSSAARNVRLVDVMLGLDVDKFYAMYENLLKKSNVCGPIATNAFSFAPQPPDKGTTE